MSLTENRTWNQLWPGKSDTKTRVKEGIIYLQGEQSHFHAAVAKALGLDSKDDHLTFDISFDLFQSWKNKMITYRVVYAVERHLTK